MFKRTLLLSAGLSAGLLTLIGPAPDAEAFWYARGWRGGIAVGGFRPPAVVTPYYLNGCLRCAPYYHPAIAAALAARAAAMAGGAAAAAGAATAAPAPAPQPTTAAAAAPTGQPSSDDAAASNNAGSSSTADASSSPAPSGNDKASACAARLSKELESDLRCDRAACHQPRRPQGRRRDRDPAIGDVRQDRASDSQELSPGRRPVSGAARRQLAATGPGNLAVESLSKRSLQCTTPECALKGLRTCR